MNIMNVMFVTGGCGPGKEKNMFFSFSESAKGYLWLITLHNVHKLAATLALPIKTALSSLNDSLFMNIMQIYEEGLFNGFFWKRRAGDGGFMSQFMNIKNRSS